jgi:hypothetical protein
VLHSVNATDEPVMRRKLRRRKVLDFLAAWLPTRIGLEPEGRSLLEEVQMA